MTDNHDPEATLLWHSNPSTCLQPSVPFVLRGRQYWGFAGESWQRGPFAAVIALLNLEDDRVDQILRDVMHLRVVGYETQGGPEVQAWPEKGEDE